MVSFEQNNEDSNSLIAIELNDRDHKIKEERTHRLDSNPDKQILIASATEASKKKKR